MVELSGKSGDLFGFESLELVFIVSTHLKNEMWATRPRSQERDLEHPDLLRIKREPPAR